MAEICEGVREYAEEMPVEIVLDGDSQRLCIKAQNEGGCNHILIDMLDLIAYLRKAGYLNA